MVENYIDERVSDFRVQNEYPNDVGSMQSAESSEISTDWEPFNCAQQSQLLNQCQVNKKTIIQKIQLINLLSRAARTAALVAAL